MVTGIFAVMTEGPGKYISNIIVSMMALLIMNYAMVYNNPAIITTAQDEVAALLSSCPDNEIESVFELVTEEWMEMEDCVPEQDTEDEPEDLTKAKTLYAVIVSNITPSTVYIAAAPDFIACNDLCLHAFAINIPTPPPDKMLSV